MSRAIKDEDYVNLGAYASRDKFVPLGNMGIAVMGVAKIASHAKFIEHKLFIITIASIAFAMYLVYLSISRSTLFSRLPEKSISFRYAWMGIPIKEEVIPARHFVWARVRQQAERCDYFVEIGTPGYETMEVFSFPYKKGKGFGLAQDKLEEIAGLWNLEKKNFQVGPV